jgi:oligopeptide/dipeptide ABC transporter ATP-binding protein
MAASADAASPLHVEDLRTYFELDAGTLRAVDGVSFTLSSGRVLCIVGESGSGKSATALSIMRLIDPPGRIVGGRVLFKGQDLMRLPEREMEALRGNRIGMVFQNPMTSLDPSFRIGEQIAETLITHERLAAAAARRRAIELLRLVGIPDAERRYDDYPHQFSGGMRQRVLIAAAIACKPDVLIADEPTTALDVTIQAQILRLLADLQRRLGSAMVLITHDLGVVAAMADEVLVMYAGRVVEIADVDTVFHAPKHPYTWGLLQSLVRLEDARDTPLQPIAGAPPSLIDLPPGCPFRPRCAHAIERCATDAPALAAIGNGHRVACHLAAAS